MSSSDERTTKTETIVSIVPPRPGNPWGAVWLFPYYPPSAFWPRDEVPAAKEDKRDGK